MPVAKTVVDSSESWPALPLSAWTDTYATLHMWTQIVGKVRLTLSPHVNHWWEVPLYVNARGLTTSPIPYRKGVFEIQFDFIQHKLDVTTSSGEARSIRLEPRTVADFNAEFLSLLQSLEIDVKIWNMPVEILNPIRFDQDSVHGSYDPQYANAFWRILVNVDAIFKEFRSRFLGKVSPVHFFWGSFDLAVTRFSGRRAPPPPSNPNIPDFINREAYSHEVSSCGFWPGNGGFGRPAFYSYAYPQPAGFADAAITPPASFYAKDLGEFVLPYDAVREAPRPRELLLDFLESTYAAAADLAKWDRALLDRP